MLANTWAVGRSIVLLWFVGLYTRWLTGASWRARTGVCQTCRCEQHFRTTDRSKPLSAKHAQSEQHLDSARHMKLFRLSVCCRAACGEETCTYIRQVILFYNQVRTDPLITLFFNPGVFLSRKIPICRCIFNYFNIIPLRFDLTIPIRVSLTHLLWSLN